MANYSVPKSLRGAKQSGLYSYAKSFAEGGAESYQKVVKALRQATPQLFKTTAGRTLGYEIASAAYAESKAMTDRFRGGRVIPKSLGRMNSELPNETRYLVRIDVKDSEGDSMPPIYRNVDESKRLSNKELMAIALGKLERASLTEYRYKGAFDEIDLDSVEVTILSYQYRS